MGSRYSLVNTTIVHALPQCIQDCGIQLFPQYNCTLQEACFCQATGPLPIALSECAVSTCPTPEDALAGQTFQDDACKLEMGNNTALLDIVTYVLFVIATFALLARLLSRWQRLQGAGFSYDDYAVIFCYIPVLGTTIVAHYEGKYGSSFTMWQRNATDIRKFLMWFYAGECFYLAATYLTKVSLILLYLRIWPESVPHTSFRMACWITSGLIVATWFGTTMSTILACSPVDYAWNVAVGEKGVCMDRQASIYAYGALNITYDFVVLLLPIPRLMLLNVSAGDKVGISACFLVGFVVTICSIIRITKLQGLQQSHSTTWNVAPAALWSLIEVYCSLICCCMPAMAGLVKRCWRYLRKRPSTYTTQLSDPTSCCGVTELARGVKEEERWKGEEERWKEDEEGKPHVTRSRSPAGSTRTDFVQRALSPIQIRRAGFRKTL